ncbi:MAG: hypothetical protein M3Y79_05515 [Pseudomonadota bacterium]|nr:hypothetical protein [Pseudomonadota bacterium]
MHAFYDRVRADPLIGVVKPEQPHEVEPVGAVRTYVEFFSAAAVPGGPHTTQVL